MKAGTRNSRTEGETRSPGTAGVGPAAAARKHLNPASSAHGSVAAPVVGGIFIWLPFHDQRQRSFARLSSTAAALARPGAGVQVERPQRSEDERPGRRRGPSDTG